MPGTLWARCMSFERSGLPVAVWVPETTQLLEPAMQPSQMGLRRVCWRVIRSSGVAVPEFVSPAHRDETAIGGAPGLWCRVGESAVALPRDAHLRRKVRAEDGAPGFI